MNSHESTAVEREARPMADDSRRVLLIADLSGYTGYLVGSEPEEAPLIAGDLVQTIADQFAGDYELAGLEGDAVFMYAPLDGTSGASVLAGIARCYGAFQRRIESVRQATTCTCKACQLAPDLDLKFFVHVGTAVRQQIAGRDELAGRDVILVHRLLKGSAPAATGTRSYVLLTDAAVQALEIEPAASGLEPVRQSYEHFGEITAHVGAPNEAWLGPTDAMIGEGSTALIDVEREYAASPATLWELLTVPARREAWEGIEHIEEVPATGGRGIGTLSRCVARRLATMEEIVAWHPPNAFSRRTQVPGVGTVTETYELREVDGATRLRVRWYAADESASAPGAVEESLRQALDRLASLTSEALQGLLTA
jgi:uncharacterized protein DUF2652/polyketide cyclase/dehydrase/lipid transport protein